MSAHCGHNGTLERHCGSNIFGKPQTCTQRLHWVSNFGRQLTRPRHQALNFQGEAFVLEKERMACDVDTGAVFKHPVHCFGCDQAFYFTLRKIAEAKKLACPLCGSDINLTDEAYGFVVTSAKETIALIDQSSWDRQRTSVARSGADMSPRI
jgi:hypothetical protein